MAVVLSVAGVSAEAEFERIRRVYMGLNWLWPKHFVDKVVELKTPAAYADWLAHNKTTFGAGAASHAATSPLVWLNANQYFPTFSALLAHLRPPFAQAFAAELKETSVVKINTSGFASCIWFQRASAAAAAFAEMFPGKVTCTVHSKVDRPAFKAWLPTIHKALSAHAFGDDVLESIKNHVGSPLNWFGAPLPDSPAPASTKMEEDASMEFIGGCDALCAMIRERVPLPAPPGPKSPVFDELKAPLKDVDSKDDAKYDFDLLVIGGGSGGLACSKAAAEYGKRVACCDFVAPSPAGSTWGLGGTCVNVGCIPKKLMHTAALHGEARHDAQHFGWEHKGAAVTHNWAKMVYNVQAYIHTLNSGYQSQLKSKHVTYLNAMASFVDPHTLQLVDGKGVKTTKTARRIVVAVGGRPAYPKIPGVELGISSDDLFSLKHSPGTTMVIGASYVALECAGFLTGLGLSTTVMVRSILLRGFDTACADRIGDYMESGNSEEARNTKFLWEFVPVKIERVPADAKSDAGRLCVSYVATAQEKLYNSVVNSGGAASATAGLVVHKAIVDTVLFATGRVASTGVLNLQSAGLSVDAGTQKIPVRFEQTVVPHIYALGDCAVTHQPYLPPIALELTPVAIHAGKLLAARLYGGATATTDYRNVPTTVFTPIEYGAVGWSEEGAVAEFGKENIDVWHSYFQPLEMTLSNRMNDDKTQCYAKLITHKKDKDRVLGFHILSPNAGEITQGVGVAIKCGATKAEFDATIGIHPTIAEQFTTFDVTKGSGKRAAKTGC